MLSFIRLDCGQGGDVLLHGNVLSHQPALIDLQKSRKKMGDIGTRHGFAAHVLTHMTFAKFDIELLSRMHKVNLFDIAERHSDVQPVGERFRHTSPFSSIFIKR